MRHLVGVALLSVLGACCSGLAQEILLFVAPFDSSAAGEPEIGKKVSVILNLQVWQTLRIPLAGSGRSTKGAVTWDVAAEPPATYLEADELAAQTGDPNFVLWGKAWRYGNGNVVEAFLLIRDTQKKRDAFPAWTVRLNDGSTFSVGVPRRQVDFAPIVLRADLLADLREPSGLKLYDGPSGTETHGYTGDYFQALEQGPDSAKVRLPDGRTGWVRLPNLSRNPSEVVNFSAGLLRVFRQDWDGATALLQRVVNNPHAPTGVRIDALLYLAIAAAHTGGDPYGFVRSAYELEPYSKTTIQYLCMVQLWEISRAPQTASDRAKTLREILQRNQRLLAPNDHWFAKISTFLSSVMP